MEKLDSLNWKNIHTIVFDFDGIFTDNKVYISQEGKELIKCDKSDSLGLNYLRKFVDLNNWDLDYFILTMESNPVVMQRAKKLQIKCYQSVENKLEFIEQRLKKRFNETNQSKKGLVYLGNDLNDYKSMQFAGLGVSPNDANKNIKKISDIVLKKNGGGGFIREFIDLLLNLGNIDDKLEDGILLN